MNITILTLFSDAFSGFFGSSIMARAIKNGLVTVTAVNIRDFANDKHATVDDKPYGGGVGMVLKVDVVKRALDELKTSQSKVILLTPQGTTFTQKEAMNLSEEENIILICGHYEGFDERIRDFVHQELSIGDYILTGGEIPAAVVIDAVVRLLPGVLGKDRSSEDESFSTGLLEYPQYTKPVEFEGKLVPKILLSGDHAKISAWRQEQALSRTKIRRPDLLKK